VYYPRRGYTDRPPAADVEAPSRDRRLATIAPGYSFDGIADLFGFDGAAVRLRILAKHAPAVRGPNSPGRRRQRAPWRADRAVRPLSNWPDVKFYNVQEQPKHLCDLEPSSAAIALAETGHVASYRTPITARCCGVSSR
jgi:hypothetical protein